MANRNLVIDTSIVISSFRAHDRRKAILFDLSEQYNLFVSSITVFELYAGATTIQKVRAIDSVLKDITELPLTNEIAKKAGYIQRLLRETNEQIEFRDLLIGTTALMHDLPLATTNLRHFERIPQLTLLAI